MNVTKDSDASEQTLPLLTRRQQTFVNALLQGKTASDAYRNAYNCNAMSKAAIWVEASRLRRNTKVSLWLTHFQQIGMDAAGVTIEAHLVELARARELALANGQISAGVQAEHYRGKAAGLYEDRRSLASGPSDVDLIKAIEDTLGKGLADEIATRLEEKRPQRSVCIPTNGVFSLWLRGAASELGVRLSQIGYGHRHLAGGLGDDRGPGQQSVPSMQDEDVWVFIDIAGLE